MVEPPSQATQLSYVAEGAGPPVLLLPGLGLSSSAWLPAIPHLRECFETIRVDNRGTGASAAPQGPYTIDEMADDTAALIDSLGRGPVDVVGWSLGASVVQSLLIRHGALVSRAVLLNGFPSYTEVQRRWLDMSLALRRTGLDPVDIAMYGMPWSFTVRTLADHEAVRERAQHVGDDPQPTSLQAFEAQAAGLRLYDSRPGLHEVRAATLVLAGAEDVLTPVSQSIEMARLIPGSKLQVLPRGGHAMIWEYTADTTDAICGFLRS